MSQMVAGLLADQKIRLGPVKIIPRGLAGVVEGFDYMKRGDVSVPGALASFMTDVRGLIAQVSGEKILYRIAETPPID